MPTTISLCDCSKRYRTLLPRYRVSICFSTAVIINYIFHRRTEDDSIEGAGGALGGLLRTRQPCCSSLLDIGRHLTATFTDSDIWKRNGVLSVYAHLVCTPSYRESLGNLIKGRREGSFVKRDVEARSNGYCELQNVRLLLTCAISPLDNPTYTHTIHTEKRE